MKNNKLINLLWQISNHTNLENKVCVCAEIDLCSLAWEYFQDTPLSEESKSEESQIFYFLIHKAEMDPEGCVPIDDRQYQWDWNGATE